MKARRSNTKITPHGGAVPILKKIKEFGIPQVIRGCLGKRKKQAIYGYEDIFIAWVLTALCGGTRLEHISKLKKKLNIIPGLKLPSHDTLGLVFKKLATETKVKRTISRDRNAKIAFSEYNENLPLNEMLVKATKRIGLIKEGKKYTLHIDTTIIETKCADSKFTYTKKYGFNPMICLIDDLPIYVSMRNGNVSPLFQITDCLTQCLDLLEKHNIRVGKVISDSAAYSVELMKMLDSRKITFSIRPKFNKQHKPMVNAITKYNDWRETEIKTTNSVWNCQIGDIPYTPLGSTEKYRLIILKFPTKQTIEAKETQEEKISREQREQKIKKLRDSNRLKPRKNVGYGSGKGKFLEGYQYKFFFTSDFSLSPEQVVLEFNKRGGEERNFDYMKNDFGWALPPFMKMNQNTVFFIAAALANNIFRGVVKLFKKDIPELRLNATLPEFQFVFIHVSCQLITGTYVYYNTDIAFEKIV